MADKQTLIQFARDIPKAELHVHLEGTLEPRLARSLAAKNNVPLQLPPETSESSYPFHDLPSFLTVYYGAMSVLLTADDFEELARAYLKKAHEQNVKHVEIFFDPQAHTSRGVAFDDVLKGIHRALSQAPSEFGMSAKAIMCFLREESVDSAMHTLNAAMQSAHRDVIVGVGLDSNERGNPPNKFRGVFAKVREETDWKITVHCDVDQENSIEHIRQALEDIKVDRIDHGSNIVESDDLVKVAINRNIGLTCCPLSNSVICDDFKSKEILNLVRRNVLVTINSDDPAYFRGYVNESLDMMVSRSDVSREELARFQYNAFKISWIEDAERYRLIRILDDFMKA